MENKKYNFHEIGKVSENFQKYFGVNFKSYYDSLSSILFKKLVIDVIKFDDYLRAKYRYDEKKEISLSAFLINQFGVEAWRFFKTLMP